jgi:hypothetical protein
MESGKAGLVANGMQKLYNRDILLWYLKHSFQKLLFVDFEGVLLFKILTRIDCMV